MKVELNGEEGWALLSTIARQVIDAVDCTDEDRASLRRWRSEQMRPGGEGMRLLVQKLNDDLERLGRARERSAIRRHDWV